MNRFFDFSNRQLRFIALLCLTALIMGGYLFVRAYSGEAAGLSTPTLSLGDDQQRFTGIFQIDPNTAPADSLELLPGIGSVLADRIVAYRAARPFEEPVDLTNVKGIGPRLYERLKPYIRIKPW